MSTALRVWGLGRVVLTVGAAVLLIETTAADQFSLPGIEDRINGWSLVPALVALTLAEPLVDRAPQLTEHATRSPVAIALARLALACAGAGAVAGYCLWSPDGALVAPWVLAALGLAAVAVAMIGPWYWALILPIGFGWLQAAAGQFPSPSFGMPATVLLVIVVSSALAYVAGSLIRARPAGRPPARRRPWTP